MSKAWNPQKLMEALFKHIHDCVDFSESGGIVIGEAQKLTTAYTKILTTGIFNSACLIWDEKLEAYKPWENFKIHLSMSYRQHRQINGKQMQYPGMQMLL